MRPVKRTGGGGPCPDGTSRRRGQRGSSYGRGSHASSSGGDCWAETYASWNGSFVPLDEQSPQWRTTRQIWVSVAGAKTAKRPETRGTDGARLGAICPNHTHRPWHARAVFWAVDNLLWSRLHLDLQGFARFSTRGKAFHTLWITMWTKVGQTCLTFGKYFTKSSESQTQRGG
jgi:hypothetical protein